MAFVTSIDLDQPFHLSNLIWTYTSHVIFTEAFKKHLISCRHRNHMDVQADIYVQIQMLEIAQQPSYVYENMKCLMIRGHLWKAF